MQLTCFLALPAPFAGPDSPPVPLQLSAQANERPRARGAGLGVVCLPLGRHQGSPRGKNNPYPAPIKLPPSPNITPEQLHRRLSCSSQKAPDSSKDFLCSSCKSIVNFQLCSNMLPCGLVSLLQALMPLLAEGEGGRAYVAAYKNFAAQGARVIALATRNLGPDSADTDLRSIPR